MGCKRIGYTEKLREARRNTEKEIRVGTTHELSLYYIIKCRRLVMFIEI